MAKVASFPVLAGIQITDSLTNIAVSGTDLM